MEREPEIHGSANKKDCSTRNSNRNSNRNSRSILLLCALMLSSTTITLIINTIFIIVITIIMIIIIVISILVRHCQVLSAIVIHNFYCSTNP